MVRHLIGKCISLSEGESVVLCDVISYQGSGFYHVCLTRGLVDAGPKRFLSLSTIHESVLGELIVSVD